MMLAKLVQWNLSNKMQSFMLVLFFASYSRYGDNWSYHWSNKIQAATCQELLLTLNLLIIYMITLILFPVKMSLKKLKLFFFDLCLIWLWLYIILTILLILQSTLRYFYLKGRDFLYRKGYQCLCCWRFK